MLKIFRVIKTGWKAMNTSEKIGVIIDMICGAGCAIIGGKVGDKLCEGSTSRLERFIVKTTIAGASLAGAETGSDALKRNYGNLAGAVIDQARGKAKMKNPQFKTDGTIEWEVEHHE